jgi:hypothetical protein
VFTAARAHGAEPVIDESTSSAAPAREWWYTHASIRFQVLAAHLPAAVTDLTRRTRTMKYRLLASRLRAPPPKCL